MTPETPTPEFETSELETSDSVASASRIFLFAGEASGDLHGSHLMRSLAATNPNITFEGVGGPRMQEVGLDLILPMETFQVMGFSDVFLALPRLWRHFRKIKKHLLSTEPDAIVLIDYPGFNLRMAKALRDSGYKGKIVQYVSPTVWAHGRHRIQHLADTVDLLLTILPFEERYFQGSGLPVTYVGHPLVDYVKEYSYQDDWFEAVGLKDTRHLVGIFPGSRRSELRHNLPNQLIAAKQLHRMHPSTRVAISCADPSLMPLIRRCIAAYQQYFLHEIVVVPQRYTYELMRDSRVATAVSGTATLELALHETPTLVVYHVTMFNRMIAQYVLKLTMTSYCIVNILKRRDIFPELIVLAFDKRVAYRYLERLYRHGHTRSDCLAGCKSIRETLDSLGASDRAAEAIVKLIAGKVEHRS